MSNTIPSREGKVAKIFTHHFGDHVLRNTLIDGDIWWGAEDLLTLTGRMDLSDIPDLKECSIQTVTGRSDEGIEKLEVIDMNGLERLMIASKTLGMKKFRDWIVETAIPATKDKPEARRFSGIRTQPVKASKPAPQSTDTKEKIQMKNSTNNSPTNAIATAPQIFEHEEFGALEVMVIEGRPFFPATECAKILGYCNPQKAVRTHCVGVTETGTPTAGGIQKKNYIPESDLYRLIMRSKLPTAQKFEAWVVEDVLPSIRQHGMYMTSSIMEQVVGDPQAFADLAAAYAAAHKENLRHLKKIEEDKPKVAFADCVTMSSVAIPVGDLAKLLHQNGCNIGRNRLYEWLRENDYVIKSGASKNMPLQRWMEAGLFVIHEATFYNGSEWVPTCTTMVTGKGQLYFINLFCGKEVAV